MEIVFVGVIYLCIGVVFLLFNAFAAGYLGMEISKKEWVDSIIWPISAAIGLGLLVRIIVEKLKERKEKKLKAKKVGK